MYKAEKGPLEVKMQVVPGKILDSFTAMDVAQVAPLTCSRLREEHEKMALGTSTGHVYIMEVATLKRLGRRCLFSGPLRPMLDLRGHRSMIRRAVWMAFQVSKHLKVKLDSEQQRVATCSPDGADLSEDAT